MQSTELLGEEDQSSGVRSMSYVTLPKTPPDAIRDLVSSPFLRVRRGPPYRVEDTFPSFDPVLWLSSKVSSLAEAAYADRTDGIVLSNDRLLVLADALQDAGCPQTFRCPRCDGRGQYDEIGPNTLPVTCQSCGGDGHLPHPLLPHLRSSGPHYVGCWAVDLILNKE